jgi:hypothetical protein
MAEQLVYSQTYGVVSLSQGQKNRLTRLAKKEGARLTNVAKKDHYGVTGWHQLRGVRLSNAAKKGNYRGMLQFTPLKKLRAKGII